MLIKEINDLRRELKISRTQLHDLEAAMGLHRKNNSQSALAIEHHPKNKNAEMELELEEKRKVVDMQHNEILKLRNEIYEIEKTFMARPASGGRLPPVQVGGQ